MPKITPEDYKCNGCGKCEACLLYAGKDFWFAWVWVSKADPSYRVSRFFDSRKEAILYGQEINGTKLIKVKVMI